MTRNRLATVYLAALALALGLLFLVQPHAHGDLDERFDVMQCTPMTARRHDAWASVFRHFPDRVRLDVDGYIAPTDCATIGNEYTLIMRGHAYRVVAADCKNRSEPLADDAATRLDVDYRLWYASGAPARPVRVVVCQ